ncbi:MAG TPA: TetR/AcrR family transcriptional regulator [Thermoleophilaceae bacterium]|jgi:AcrR family transcriptional regulator
MIRSAAHLFRRHGYSGTGFRDVIAHSGAPRGSIYHHFPGGKAELAAETVRRVGERIGSDLDPLAERGEALEMLAQLVSLWRQTLLDSDFRAGCPVLAVAIEDHPESPQLAPAAAESFARLMRPLGEAVRRAGASDERAGRLAVLIFASLEGAVALCRVTRGLDPLDDVEAELERAVRAAIAQ